LSERNPQKGDVVRAASLNELAQKIEGFSRLRVAAPLSLQHGCAGPSIGLPGGLEGGSFFAQLMSVSGVAYGWREVYLGTDHAWHPKSEGRTGTPTVLPAYEFNFATDVPTGAGTGAVVELLPGANGKDFRFVFNRAPVGSSGPCGQRHNTLCLRAVGCACGWLAPGVQADATAVGATFTITGSNGDSYTVTQPASGSVCVALSNFGTYTVVCDPSTMTNGFGNRFQSQTQSWTFPAGSCGGNGNLFFQLPPAAGYACACCVQPEPISTSLVLIDKYGSHPLTWSGSGGGFSTSFMATVNGATLSPQCLTPPPPPEPCYASWFLIPGPITHQICYSLGCSCTTWPGPPYNFLFPGKWSLTKRCHIDKTSCSDCYTRIPDTYYMYNDPIWGSCDAWWTVQSSDSLCPPVMLSFTFGTDANYYKFGFGPYHIQCAEMQDTVSVHE
jgi:hypothetical protein